MRITEDPDLKEWARWMEAVGKYFEQCHDEEMIEFVEWIKESRYEPDRVFNTGWIHEHSPTTISTSELLKLFRERNKKSPS